MSTVITRKRLAKIIDFLERNYCCDPQEDYEIFTDGLDNPCYIVHYSGYRSKGYAQWPYALVNVQNGQSAHIDICPVD